ncbi:MAG: MarR family transcriptional regulator [Oscillospiraceae bacterium]
MDNKQQKVLNTFFVETFNKVLSLEEHYISKQVNSELTVRELHIIEVVSKLEPCNCSTMSKTAQSLSITIGALTTAVNVLVRKGYINRGQDPKDRRIVYLHLTEKGKQAEKIHHKFHEEMIENVSVSLSDDELEALISSLEKLSKFFEAPVKEGE